MQKIRIILALALACSTSLVHAQGSGLFTTVQAAEAYFDNPATPEGAGTSLPLQGALTDPINTAIGGVSASGLAPGPHVVFVRFQDSDGVWGPAISSLVVVNDPEGLGDDASIAAAEGFIFPGGTGTAGPGNGLGTAFVAEDGSFDETVEIVRGSIDSTGLPARAPRLAGFRTRDSLNLWSEAIEAQTVIDPEGSDTPPAEAQIAIVSGRAAFGGTGFTQVSRLGPPGVTALLEFNDSLDSDGIVTTGANLLRFFGRDNNPLNSVIFEQVFVCPDGDCDGIAPGADNCPAISNTGQENNDGDANGDVCDADDDNDTIPDIYENDNDLDPFDASDANEDADGDGLSNLAEFNGGTAANNPDTDGDGIGDNLDDQATVSSNVCTGANAIYANRTVGNGVSEQCAASTSITVGDTAIVQSGGSVELLAPNVSFDTGFSVPLGGQLGVQSGNPTPP